MQLSKVNLFVFVGVLSFSCFLQSMESNVENIFLPLLSFRQPQHNQPNECQKPIQLNNKKAIEFLQKVIHINSIITSRNHLSDSTIKSINEIKEKIEGTIKIMEDDKNNLIVYEAFSSIIKDIHAFKQTLKQAKPPIPWYSIQQLGLCSNNLSTLQYIPES